MSQKSEVLEYLKTHKSITIYEAIYSMGITRLSDRIYCLKKDGYNIKTMSKKVKKKNGEYVSVAEYSLVEG